MKAVKAKWLITSADNIYENYGFTYTKTKIEEIVSNAEIDALFEAGKLTKILDAQDKIVFPGFVNAHMHQYGILSRGIPSVESVVDFESFLNEYWWPLIENRIRTREVIVTAQASAIEMISSGITSFCDCLEAPMAEEDVLEKQAAVIEEIGMRAIIGLESSVRISPENGKRCLIMNDKAIHYCRKHCKLVKGSVCTHTTFTCPDDFIKEAVKLAKDEQTVYQFHMSESKYEPEAAEKAGKKRPALIYNDLNALTENTIVTQCVKIREEEIDVLAANGAKAVHMPISNCEVGGGFSPVPKMLQKSICVALGTDGYINDFFEVMRAAFLVHKAVEESTVVMPSATVFQMATENGAKALGLKAGKLEMNYLPDFVVLEDSFLTPITGDNLMDQMVVNGKKEYITDVYIAGKPVLKDRKLCTLDKKTVNAEMKVCAKHFWQPLY